MGDHFVLCVDRLITASTLESAAAEAQRPSLYGHVPFQQNRVPPLPDSSPQVFDVVSSFGGAESSERVPDPGTLDSEDGAFTLVECRICQEEDDDRNMESPCACSGSLKYAHRKCVQRWCNEKGDITCEICHQQYKPDYTAPQPAFPDDLPIDIRSSWQISEAELDLRDPRLLAMVAAERHFFEAEYSEYASANSSSASWCRSVALILMALLLLRHALAITNSGGDEDASTFFTLFLLRAAGFILPCYIMARAMSVVHRRRQRQEAIAAAEVALRLQEGQARTANRQHLINVQ
uniref:RING-CH-type domain-containing protein n=1 Tax=Araucaria cunninghamii TaxID=56994 RepID=A0A0D6QZG1_ARACU